MACVQGDTCTREDNPLWELRTRAGPAYETQHTHINTQHFKLHHYSVVCVLHPELQSQCFKGAYVVVNHFACGRRLRLLQA